MKQSRFMSLVESITNVAVGYLLALATQLVVFPLFGITATLPEHLAIGAAFTGVSVLRSYTLRRLFEAWRVRREQFALLRNSDHQTNRNRAIIAILLLLNRLARAPSSASMTPSRWRWR